MSDKTKVMVVDDDRRMVRTICDIFRIKGYEAIEAHSGEEAIEKVKSEMPDCLFIDLRMPGLGGIDTLKILRDSAPSLPVVLMSAYATEEQAEVARELGAYAVLNKPLDFQMVLTFLSLVGKERSILVVDDDPEYCLSLKDVLGARGYIVENEANPENVLSHMERDYKLVVLLDLKIGERDGNDVLKAVRARYPTKPVILVVGHENGMADSIRKGFEIGAYACLHKPLEIEELTRYVAEIDRKKLSALLGERVEL